MEAKVYCRAKGWGTLEYFLSDGKREYYLFTADYHRVCANFFSRGRRVGEVLEMRKHNNPHLQRAGARLIGMVKYIESEHGICVFDKTMKRKQTVRSSKMLRKSEMAYRQVALSF